MKLNESVKPISYLKANATEMLRTLSESRTPYVITQNGEAKAVLQDLASYEELQESLAMLKLVEQGLRAKERGEVVSVEEAFSRMRKGRRAKS